MTTIEVDPIPFIAKTKRRLQQEQVVSSLQTDLLQYRSLFEESVSNNHELVKEIQAKNERIAQLEKQVERSNLEKTIAQWEYLPNGKRNHSQRLKQELERSTEVLNQVQMSLEDIFKLTYGMDPAALLPDSPYMSIIQKIEATVEANEETLKKVEAG